MNQKEVLAMIEANKSVAVHKLFYADDGSFKAYNSFGIEVTQEVITAIQKKMQLEKIEVF